MYTYVCMCVCVLTGTASCSYRFVYGCMCVCMHACLYACMHAINAAFMQNSICQVLGPVYVCMYVDANTHTQLTPTYIHTYIHTYRYVPLDAPGGIPKTAAKDWK